MEYALREGAKGGDPLHPHGGHTDFVQGLEIASPLQHAADGRGEQAQIPLVVVGEPVAVTWSTGDLVDQLEGTEDLVAQPQGDAHEGAIDTGGEMRGDLRDVRIVPIPQRRLLAYLDRFSTVNDVSRQSFPRHVR